MQSLNDAVNQALILAAKAHSWHLATTSYAQHMAFGELYEYFHTAADKLSEAAQGAGIEYSADFSLGMRKLFTPLEQGIADTEAYITQLEKLNDECDDMPWLENIVQEIQSGLYSILYKLKRLS